ncbi:MAG TPA: neutral zinc metallopeptidase [Pirellulales bacterium]|nr:neutral zinc metallopeptidase [Pirellulales bacterium]
MRSRPKTSEKQVARRNIAMQWEDREESQNVEDDRGEQGGGGMRYALGGAGSLVFVIVALVLGVNPAQLANMIGNGPAPPGPPQNARQAGPPPHADPAEERLAHFTKVIFGDTERIWTEVFQRRNSNYPKPTLHLYTGQVQTACGGAEAAVGPFYCPGDAKVYIDLSFYRDLEVKLHANGDFAKAYVIAHEVGHHVQRLLGYDKAVDLARRRGDPVEANHMSVRLELQADYFAGVWAYWGQKKYNFLQAGDIESALNAANQIGDDTLQRKARGTVMPDSFTHGTSAQRMKWFKKGFDTGDVDGAAAIFSLPYNQL